MTNRLELWASGRSGGRRAPSPGLRRVGALLLGCIAIGWALVPGTAWAEGATPHEVVWGHASPGSVSRFVVFVSAVRGRQEGARRVDVGKPSGQPSGTLQVFSAIVPIASEEFVAIAAVGQDGAMGPLSSWSAVPPSRPGQPIVIVP